MGFATVAKMGCVVVSFGAALALGADVATHTHEKSVPAPIVQAQPLAPERPMLANPEPEHPVLTNPDQGQFPVNGPVGVRACPSFELP